jgi:hypothetical protein
LDTSENKIAKCYILHDNDEGNKCELTDRRLLITRKGKRFEFASENLKNVASNQRKLLIPIILSGVLTPLILAGFFKGLFHPFVALVFIIGGVFTFYIGWIGEKTLTINLLMGHRDFPVSFISEHLAGFMDFVNRYIQGEPIEKRVLYLKTGNFVEADIDLSKYLAKDVVKRELYSYWQLRDHYLTGKLQSRSSYIVLDPFKVGSEIKYVKNPDNRGLTPVIKGSINHKAVLKILQFDEIGSIIE